MFNRQGVRGPVRTSWQPTPPDGIQGARGGIGAREPEPIVPFNPQRQTTRPVDLSEKGRPRGSEEGTHRSGRVPRNHPPAAADGIQGPQDRQGVSRSHRTTNAHQAAPMPTAGPGLAFVERKSPRAGRALR